MNYRVLYFNKKIFYFYEFENFNDAQEKYNEIDVNNKIIIEIKTFDIKEKNGEENIIKKILEFNHKKLYNYENINEEKKYHIAILFPCHFSPGCEDVLELQLNNLINCTFDIFIVTEKKRCYQRFLLMKHYFSNLNNIKDYHQEEMREYFINLDDSLNDEKLKILFGKYAKNIKKIIYVEDFEEEFNNITNNNTIKFEKRFNKKRDINYDYETFKFYKSFLELDKYIKNNKINYDLILKTRSDNILTNQILISKNLIEKCGQYITGSNPIFILAKYEYMKWLSKFILHTFEYGENYKFGEAEFAKHCLKNNIKYNNNLINNEKYLHKLQRLWVINHKINFKNNYGFIGEENLPFWQLYI